MPPGRRRPDSIAVTPVRLRVYRSRTRTCSGGAVPRRRAARSSWRRWRGGPRRSSSTGSMPPVPSNWARSTWPSSPPAQPGTTRIWVTAATRGTPNVRPAARPAAVRRRRRRVSSSARSAPIPAARSAIRRRSAGSMASNPPTGRYRVPVRCRARGPSTPSARSPAPPPTAGCCSRWSPGRMRATRRAWRRRRG